MSNIKCNMFQYLGIPTVVLSLASIPDKPPPLFRLLLYTVNKSSPLLKKATHGANWR